MQWEGAWLYDEPVDTEENRYRYNGKEYSKGSRLSDYGARYYSSDIGRWNAVDPLAEKYSNWSSYNYAVNNPLGLIDLDGLFPIDPNIIKSFPRIASFISGGGLEKYLTGSQRILSTLNFYSSGFLNQNQIKSDFMPKNGPKIVLVSNQELRNRGFDSPENFKGRWDYHTQTIELGEAFLNRIENILKNVDGDSKKTAAILMEFTSTFVNEYTHYGDFQDGLDMQIKDGKWQNIGIEPDFKDDEGNAAAEYLFPFEFGIYNYEMYKEGKHKPNNQDETMIPNNE